MARRLATVEQAADYLGLHPNTVRNYINAGRFPAYKIGPRYLRIDLNEVDAALSDYRLCADGA